MKLLTAKSLDPVSTALYETVSYGFLVLLTMPEAVNINNVFRESL
jgi:hypothetical protein